MGYQYGMALNVTILQAHLNPLNAKLMEVADAPFFPDKEIHIEYRGIPRSALQDCLDALGDKCWATQFVSPATAYTVTNPVVGTVPFTGLYRNVLGSIKAVEEPRDEERHAEPRYKILQTLRQGWATTINLDEGRLTNPGGLEVLPFEAVLEFPNMAGLTVSAIAATAVDLYPTPAPASIPFTIRGETQSGTWYLHRSRYKHVEDGSGVVELKYTTEPETVDKTIQQNRFESVVETYTHDHDPLTAKTDLDTKMASATGKTKTGEIHQDEDKIWINVTRVTTAAAVQPVETVQTVDAFKTEESATDKNVADAGTPPTPPIALSPVTGQVVSITKQKTEFPGISNLTKKIVEAVSVPAATTALTTDAFTQRREATDKNAATGAAAPTPPTALAEVSGAIATERRVKTEFPGKDDITSEIVVARSVATAIQRTIINALERSATEENRNAASGDAPPTPTLPLVNTQVAGQAITITVEKTQFPDKFNKTKQVSEAIAVDSGWVTFPGRYGNNKTRIVENDTLANIAVAIADGTSGFDVFCLLSATQYFQRYTAHLHATIIYENPHQNDWTNFTEEGTGSKDYIVGGKAYTVPIAWGIKQSSSHAACKTWLATGSPVKANPKISSINGGRHFKATYLTITASPTEI